MIDRDTVTQSLSQEKYARLKQATAAWVDS